MPAGTIVNPGSLVSPGGQQGISGVASWTLTSANFTVPAVGATVVVNVQNTSWAVVGEYVWVATAGGSPSSPMALQVTAKTATTLTLLNPPTAGAQPSGDAGNLLSVGSDSLLYLPPSAIQPTIWSVRQRSFNAVGNPTFEVDQRNAGALIANISNGVWAQDRWLNVITAPTMKYTGGQSFNSFANGTILPGTNFRITNAGLHIQLTTQQATLAAGDAAFVEQSIEGPLLRELASDVHSISILAATSITGGLKFALALRDPGTGHCLVKLCTITTPNVYQLITLPNIPLWPSAGNWSVVPGTNGYKLDIVLASGSQYMAPVNDVWQNGNFLGAVGMDNFGGAPVNSTLDIAFVQHEPGPLCTTPIDKPFEQNLRECLRYYQKSVSYGQKMPSGAWKMIGYWGAGTQVRTIVQYPVKMAKNPTATVYDNAATPNSVYIDYASPNNVGVSSVGNSDDSGFGTITLSSTPAQAGTFGAYCVLGAWQVDTGW